MKCLDFTLTTMTMTDYDFKIDYETMSLGVYESMSL